MELTVSQARQVITKGRERGVRCPCCDRYIKVYKRKLTDGMAEALIYIYQYFAQINPEPWLHIPSYLQTRGAKTANAGMPALLRFWSFLEPMADNKENGTKSGRWRITDYGKQFVEGKIKVPKHAIIYRNQLEGFDQSEFITIQEALGDKFSYNELMGMK